MSKFAPPWFAESLSIYDDLDADVLRNYQEFTLANILYYSLKESTTSEQSARMTAMDNASKNACKLLPGFSRTSVVQQESVDLPLHNPFLQKSAISYLNSTLSVFFEPVQLRFCFKCGLYVDSGKGLL